MWVKNEGAWTAEIKNVKLRAAKYGTAWTWSVRVGDVILLEGNLDKSMEEDIVKMNVALSAGAYFEELSQMAYDHVEDDDE